MPLKRIAPGIVVSWLWSLSLIHISWDNLVVFRSNYGEAFRAPTLNDLFGGSIIGSSRYKSNPNLKPELSKTWDVGVDVNPTDRLTLNVTGYKTWAEDYIANIPKGKEDGYNIKIKENIDKVTIKMCIRDRVELALRRGAERAELL